MKIRNKQTNEIFTTLENFVLDAQNQYDRIKNLTYCDMEIMIKCPDGDYYYLLDECGNWEYFPSDLYEVVEP